MHKLADTMYFPHDNDKKKKIYWFASDGDDKEKI